MKLGYARISTSDQNAAMQVEALVSAGVAEGQDFRGRDVRGQVRP